MSYITMHKTASHYRYQGKDTCRGLLLGLMVSRTQDHTHRER